MRTCANCERPIGNLEVGHDWNGHEVCAECAARLTNNAPPKAAPANEILFSYNDIAVNRQRIYDNRGGLPIETILSVRTSRASFSFNVNVEVFDLARNRRVYRLKDRAMATRFIGAIQKVKGSINVEPEDQIGFIIWG